MIDRLEGVTVLNVQKVNESVVVGASGHNRRHGFLAGSRLRLLHEPTMFSLDGVEIFQTFLNNRPFHFLVPNDPNINRAWYIGEMIYQINGSQIGADAVERIESATKNEGLKHYKNVVATELKAVENEQVAEMKEQAEKYANSVISNVKESLKSPRRSPETFQQSGRKSPGMTLGYAEES